MAKRLVKQIRVDAFSLKQKVATGSYNQSDLRLLAKLINELEGNYPDAIAIIARLGSVTPTVVHYIRRDKTSPKLHNFLGTLTGLIGFCDAQIVKPFTFTQATLFDPEETIRDTQWIAEWNDIDRQKAADLITKASLAVQKLQVAIQKQNSFGIILTAPEREMLIALLKTTLTMLEAPMVEKGLMRRLVSILQISGERAVKKEVESGATKLIKGTLSAITALLVALAK